VCLRTKPFSYPNYLDLTGKVAFFFAQSRTCFAKQDQSSMPMLCWHGMVDLEVMALFYLQLWRMPRRRRVSGHGGYCELHHGLSLDNNSRGDLGLTGH